MKLPLILPATGFLVGAAGNITALSDDMSVSATTTSAVVATVVSVETLVASPSTPCYGVVSRLCDYNFPTQKPHTSEPSSYTLLDSDTRALYTYTPSAWTTPAVGTPIGTGMGTEMLSSSEAKSSSSITYNTSAVPTYGNNATTTRRMDLVGDFIAAALTFWFLMN